MSNQKTGVGQTLLNFLLFIPTVLYMAVRESGKWICRRAYSGGFVRAIFVGLVGFGVACVTSISAADYLSGQLGWSPSAWFVSSAVVFILTMTHLWPAIYVGLVRHVWNLGEWILKKVKLFAKEVFKPLTAIVVSAMRQAPGSNYLWELVEGKNGKKWGIRLLQVLLFLGAALLSALAGYVTFQALAGLVPVPMLAALHLEEIVAGVVAFTAFYFSISSLVYLLDEGDAPATAMVYSGLAAYGLTHTSLLAGASLPVVLGACAFTFLAGVTYILPAFIAVLQGGLVERLLKAWGELLDSVYAREDNLEFRRFYHHVMNIVISAAVGCVLYANVGLVNLPPLAGLVLSVLVGLYCYAEGSRDMLNRSGGNAMIGILTSLAAGYAAYSLLPAAYGLSGAWLFTAVVGGVLATGLLVYPFAYLLVRALTSWAAPACGGALETVHKNVSVGFKKLGEQISKLQRAAFDDKTGFSSLFGHLGTVALVVLAVRSLLPLAAPYMPASFWLSTAITAVVGLNLVILMNRLLSRYSAESFSFAAGITTLFLVGRLVLDASASWVAAVVVGLTAAYIIGGIVAPAVYLILRAPVNLVFTSWLAPVVDKIFDAVWNTYVATWKFVGERFAFLTKIAMIFLGPVIKAVQTAWATMRGIYDRLTGGR